MDREARAFYDDYWSRCDRPRAEARSRERAALALELLAEDGRARGRLLDVGCGPGWSLDAFTRAGWGGIGVDPSNVAVEEARARGLDARRIDVELASAEEMRAALGGPFDAIALLEVLEHLRDPLASLRKVKELCRTGGRLVVSLPNEIHLAARLRILSGKLPMGGHDSPHLRHFDRTLARRLFEEAELRVIATRDVSLVPPRRPILRAASSPGLFLFPGLFSIATVYLLGESHGKD